MTQTIFYARVPCADQTLDHRRKHAESASFQIDDIVTDQCVFGISTRLAERAENRRLFHKLRRGDVLMVRWVDRLGSDYADVTDTIREFMRKGIVMKTVINGMTFDGSTTDPVQQAVRDALITFMAATAEAHRQKPLKRPSAPGLPMPKPMNGNIRAESPASTARSSPLLATC